MIFFTKFWKIQSCSWCALKVLMVIFLLIVRNCSFCMGIIFYSSVVFIILSPKSKYSCNFGSVLQWCLVPTLSLLKVWSNEWTKKYFCSFKEHKIQSYLFQTGQDFAAHKTLVWSTYVWRAAAATFLLRNSNTWAIVSHFNQIRFILLFHDGGRYHIETTSPLICRANQWEGFYITTASVMKELKKWQCREYGFPF